MTITKHGATARTVDKSADVQKLAPATEVAASGAIIEPEIAKGVDFAHPAVDNNPRATSTPEMNQIDFNDPTISQEKAVEENLEESKASKDD